MPPSSLPESRPAVVLVASSQEWISRSLDSILGPAGYAVLRVRSGRQVLELAKVVAPDAVVIDTAISDVDGYEVCRVLREERRLSPLVPVVMLSTATTVRTDRVRAFSAGAWAFLSPPIDGESLLFQLRNFLAAKLDADRANAENLIDDPTGLYSMRGLVRRAREIGAEAVRLRVPLACIALAPHLQSDVDTQLSPGDDLQSVVDHLAAILLASGRVSDAIGRCGETEFGVVALATDAAGAAKLVQRLRDTLESDPLRLRGRAVQIQIGVGYQVSRDFAESPIDAFEMLLRASTELRSSVSGLKGESDGAAAAPSTKLVS